MSINPLVLSLLEDITRPTLFDQNFGLGLCNDDLLIPPSYFRRQPSVHPVTIYARPWRLQQSGKSNVANNPSEFKVSLDVQQFKPEEISVKVADRSVIIEGKHEERRDEHGFISRQFTRRYLLPEGTDEKAVVSSLSSDGVLTVTAPKAIKAGDGERVIPIVQTNAPAVKAQGETSGEQPQEKMEQ